MSGLLSQKFRLLSETLKLDLITRMFDPQHWRIKWGLPKANPCFQAQRRLAQELKKCWLSTFRRIVPSELKREIHAIRSNLLRLLALAIDYPGSQPASDPHGR
jgi:hypothetical protein